MSKEIIKFAILFVVMLLVQVLICNHVALFNVAVPIVFIYFIVRLPIDVGKGLLFTSAFVMGLIVDICADTPGVNALSTTLLSAFKQPVFYAYVPRDDKSEGIIPSIATLGIGTYSKFLITLVGIFCLLVFTIEYFNFADVKEIAIIAGSSTALSFLLLLAVDSLMLTK